MPDLRSYQSGQPAVLIGPAAGETPPIEFAPQLRNVTATWPKEPHTIWRLCEPVSLPRPIPAGDPKMQARMVYCDFVDLLTRNTVREIGTSSTTARHQGWGDIRAGTL